MSSIVADLAGLLDGVKRPGDFYMSGTCEILAPGLEVEGVGPVALPLLPVQAAQLIAAAEQAPYGRGEQTLVDTDVRRAWQIGPEKIHIRGRTWPRTLETIVARAAQGLGVSEPVTAELYKLLVYEEGGFFLSHRDSEKAPKMFATLIVVLPATYTGGELVIRHQGRESRLDLRCDDPSEVGFAAFYADCVHEILPLTSGCRLALVYNLTRQGRGPQPRPPSYAAEQDRIAAVLRRWDDGAPEKLIYLLEHAYTVPSLSFDALKGADAAKAATLLAAAREAECDLHLALVSIEESGSAEYHGDYRRYRDDDDDDDFEAMEVDDRSETVSGWQRPDGGTVDLGPLAIADGEVSPPGALEDLTPDDESFQEATGNAGASFERSYRRAALVLWPIRRRLAVINQGGLSATLPYLGDLTRRWAESGADRHSPLWAEAHALSGHMQASWPTANWQSHGEPGTMLALLARLGDTVRIDAFLASLSAAAALSKTDTGNIVQAIRLLPQARAAELLRAIVARHAAMSLDACVDLLVRAAVARAEFDLTPAAAALVKALPGNPARPAPAAETSWGRRPVGIDSGLVADLMIALDRIDPALADAAAHICLASPATYNLDLVVVPAVLALGRSKAAGGSAVGRLRAACSTHLRARIAEPLAPPADWTRDANVACTCPFCAELSRFLADPARQTWAFKSLQGNRSHVETTILNSRCDLDTTTVRRGSPHILQCTKNQASYERRVKQREKDLADLARLEADLR